MVLSSRAHDVQNTARTSETDPTDTESTRRSNFDFLFEGHSFNDKSKMDPSSVSDKPVEAVADSASYCKLYSMSMTMIIGD